MLTPEQDEWVISFTCPKIKTLAVTFTMVAAVATVCEIINEVVQDKQVYKTLQAANVLD